MAASRRAQIQSLCGTRTGPLIDRVESYLAAVDIWSRRGNQKAVKNAGTGMVAICCYLAAESLDARIPDRSAAIRASGLPPAQFAAAERDFRAAVQSVSNASSQALSGPSDGVNSALAASLTATPTKQRAIRSATPKTPTSASKSKEALLAKAQAIQAGSLFDQTMRASPSDASRTPTSKGRAVQPSVASHASEGNVGDAAQAAGRRDGSAHAHDDTSIQMAPRSTKRRRMGKVVFGLAIHSSLNRLDDQQEADDERRRRTRILHLQSTIDKLRSSDPTWRYLDAPRDFLITISPSQSNGVAES